MGKSFDATQATSNNATASRAWVCMWKDDYRVSSTTFVAKKVADDGITCRSQDTGRRKAHAGLNNPALRGHFHLPSRDQPQIGETTGLSALDGKKLHSRYGAKSWRNLYALVIF